MADLARHASTLALLLTTAMPATTQQVERIQIEVGPLVFEARAAGPTDGPLALLLHGFPETSYMWRDQLRALGAQGYRAVAPDQRGYSPGARPSVPTLYIWSTEDAALGREAAEATRDYVARPYRFEVLEGVDHWITERRPEYVSDQLLRHLGER